MTAERTQTPGRVIRSGWFETGGPLPVAAEPAAAARPRRPGPGRLVAVLTALALLSVAMPWLLLRAQDPEDVARTYLDALIAGDLATVRDHLVPVEGAVEAALTESLRAATPDRITGYTVEEVVVRGTTATVRVTLRTPREQHPAVLSLTAVPAGPLRVLLWELEPIRLPRLVLGPRASTGVVLLNGRRVEIPAVHWTGRTTNRPRVVLHVLPGRYTVQLPPTAAPLVPRLSHVYVPPVLGQWETGLIAVGYRPTRYGEARARSEILSELAQCLSSAVARPPDCPVGADLPADTPGSWRLVERPEITFIAMVGDSFVFRGRGLVAEFTASGDGDGDGEGALSGDVSAPEARVQTMAVDFGVILRQGRTGAAVEHWAYTTLRPWPR